MANLKFSESLIIRASAEQIFHFTQDYDRRLSWDTFLTQAYLINGATEADTGVKAYCVAKNGLGMETEYVSFQPPKVTAIKMTKGPYLFRSFLGSWTFKKRADNETEVVFLYAFSLRFPFNMMGRMIKMVLQNNVRQRLRDLKKCMEINR